MPPTLSTPVFVSRLASLHTLDSRYFTQIPGAQAAGQDVGDGFYTYPCNAELGDITVSFGDGKSYAVNPADFNLGPVSE